MKLLISSLLLVVISNLALASENGSYYDCTSKSGKSKLIIGTVGSAASEPTVELMIEGKSYGAAVIGSEVLGSSAGSVTRFTEADHDGVDWVTVEQLNTSIEEKQAGLLRMKILSGLDPRTAQPLTEKIDVVCKAVNNPT
jgi:hypothetical protein